MASTIFEKIIKKEIPAQIVYETDTVLAFKDIAPKAPVHILVIPKITEIEKFSDINGKKHSQLLGELVDAANEVAKIAGIADSGFRVVINCGNDGGQEVYHLHLHVLGGKKLPF